MFPAERHFVKTALGQMRFLEGFWGAETQPTLVSIQGSKTAEALDAIKTSACTVQARGVYRAAVMCEDVFVRLGAEGAAKFRTSLFGLKSLIRQYADGLFEIDPEFKTVIEGGATLKDKVKEAGLEKFVAAKKRAADTLKPLLELVKSESRFSALKLLIGDESEINEQATRRIGFETLMQPITNLTLSEARYNGKNVSLSYAADFDDLDNHMAKCVQSFLEILCLNIVSRGIDDKASQISLTGQKHEHHMAFTVSWQGHDIASNAHKQPHFKQAVKVLKKEGGLIKFHEAALSDLGSAAQSLEVCFARTGAVARKNPEFAQVKIGSAS